MILDEETRLAPKPCRSLMVNGQWSADAPEAPEALKQRPLVVPDVPPQPRLPYAAPVSRDRSPSAEARAKAVGRPRTRPVRVAKTSGSGVRNPAINIESILKLREAGTSNIARALRISFTSISISTSWPMSTQPARLGAIRARSRSAFSDSIAPPKRTRRRSAKRETAPVDDDGLMRQLADSAAGTSGDGQRGGHRDPERHARARGACGARRSRRASRRQQRTQTMPALRSRVCAERPRSPRVGMYGHPRAATATEEALALPGVQRAEDSSGSAVLLFLFWELGGDRQIGRFGSSAGEGAGMRDKQMLTDILHGDIQHAALPAADLRGPGGAK